MVDQIELGLVRVIDEFGDDVIKDHRRLEALLRDYCPRSPRDVFIVVQFARFTEDLRAALTTDIESAALNVTRLTGIETGLSRIAGFLWAKALKIVSLQELLFSFHCPVCSNPGKAPATTRPNKYACPRCHSIISIENNSVNLLLKKQKTALTTLRDWTLVSDTGDDWNSFQYGQYIAKIVDDSLTNETEKALRLQMPVLLTALEEYSCNFLQQHCRYPKVKLHRLAAATAKSFGDYIDIESPQSTANPNSPLTRIAPPRESSEVVAGLIYLNQFCDEPKGIVLTDKGLYLCNCLTIASPPVLVHWEDIERCRFESKTPGLIDFGFRGIVIDLRHSGISTLRFMLFLQVLKNGLSVAVSPDTPRLDTEIH